MKEKQLEELSNVIAKSQEEAITSYIPKITRIHIASAILSAGYVKKSDLVIDEDKVKELMGNEIDTWVTIGDCDIDKVSKAISTHSQELIKEKQ